MTDHQCHHRHGDGRLCGSPRLTHKNFCYYHTRLHESFILPGNRYYEAPPLTDLYNIQLALTHVWSALAKSLITHKQACAMAYQIQLAQNNLKALAQWEKDNPLPDPVTNDDNNLASDISPNADAGIPGDDVTPSPSAHPYDESNPPLCLEPALRPAFTKPPAPDSIATWVPISDAEYEKISDYEPMGPLDGLYDTYQRRRKLGSFFPQGSNPTPEEIAKALLEIEREEAQAIQGREDLVRQLRARQRDQRNRELLGL
jgi:hypothetical protein